MSYIGDQLLVKVKEAIGSAYDRTNTEVARDAVLWLQQLKSDTGSSELNIQLSLRFIQSTSTDDNLNVHYRLFGLQLLEAVISHSWNSLSNTSKVVVKEQLLKVVVADGFSENILLNALVKCVVSIVIRDWPQNWPEFTSKLFGTPNNRTALLILWRLTEDVGVLMNPTNPDRRRELLAALDEKMCDVFAYIGQSVQSPNMMVALTALKALTGILEWTPVEKSLCDFLCNVVAQDSLDDQGIEAKMVAFECISLILNRKHRCSSEKRIILSFFQNHNLSKLISCLNILLSMTSNRATLSCYSLFSLTKNVSMVFCSCGHQLLTVGSDQVPQCVFNEFIDQMLLIFEHPDPMIHSLPVNFFKESFKRRVISAEVALSLFRSVPSKMIKASEDDIFVRCEFDTFQDYEQFFYRTRAEVLDLLRLLAANEDEVMFACTSQMLESFLGGLDTNWEPLTLIIDAVFNKIPKPEKFRTKSSVIMQRLLNTSCQDATILSFQLSCISALLVFMVNEPSENFQPILSHTFKLSTFHSIQTKSEDVKNVRRHAASFFVKLCKMFPEALEPYFDDIRAQVFCWIESGVISRMEGCTLNEGLVLVSNCVKNPSTRQNFYAKIMESFGSFLQFDMSAVEFIQFIGLLGPREYVECGSNRSMFTALVSTFLSILKRSSYAEGVYKDLLSFFPSFVSLTKCMNKLWIPEFQTKTWDPATIFARTAASDKGCLLEGFCLPRVDGNDAKSEALKCQSYLWALHESLFSLLSAYLVTFGSRVLANCSTSFLSILEDEFRFLPPMKVRMILKVLIKPVSLRWPDDPEFHKLFFLPFLQNFIPHIFQQADVAWIAFRKTDWTEHEQIQEEIVEEQTNRLLSREVMDVMKVILSQEKRTLVPAEGQEMMLTDTNSSQKPSISQLGMFLLNLHLNKIVCMLLSSLSWIDSNVLFKSISINQVILDFLIENQSIQSQEEISFYIHHLLTGLSFINDDEQNQTAFLTICLTLYQHCKNIGKENLFWNSPLIDNSQWQALNLQLEKLDKGKRTAGTERKKREALRKVLSPVIGANLNQVRPEKVCDILSLGPQTFRSRKARKEPIDLQGSEICALFNE